MRREFTDLLYIENTDCHRGQWVFAHNEGVIEDEELDRQIRLNRNDCAHFTKYEPNLTPEQHRERKDERERERRERRFKVGMAVFSFFSGALATLAVQALGRLISN